jgi:hypothetical protein
MSVARLDQRVSDARSARGRERREPPRLSGGFCLLRMLPLLSRVGTVTSSSVKSECLE